MDPRYYIPVEGTFRGKNIVSYKAIYVRYCLTCGESKVMPNNYEVEEYKNDDRICVKCGSNSICFVSKSTLNENSKDVTIVLTEEDLGNISDALATAKDDAKNRLSIIKNDKWGLSGVAGIYEHDIFRFSVTSSKVNKKLEGLGWEV